MDYSFLSEQGVILNKSYDILHFVEGKRMHVDFPNSVIWGIHQLSPGEIYAFAHTHPPFMKEMSATDEEFLKAQTVALYPFPARVITLCSVGSDLFTTSVYLGCLESKELWLERNKETPRKFYMTRESEITSGINDSLFAWQKFLLTRSYEEKKINN